MVLPTLVDIYQTGFNAREVYGYQSPEAILHICKFHKTVGTRAVLSLDMAKAFYSVDLGFRGVVVKMNGHWAELQQMGLIIV